jgi:hypothetical protein
VGKAVRNDPRYAQWLEIADELVKLHEFVYGPNGPFCHIKGDEVYASSGPEVAKWIRSKCAEGRWYWWDKGWLAGKASEPLHSLDHVIGDSGGLYEETEAGREMIARIESLKARIAVVSAQKPGARS